MMKFSGSQKKHPALSSDKEHTSQKRLPANISTIHSFAHSGAGSILHLQRVIGNQAVRNLITSARQFPQMSATGAIIQRDSLRVNADRTIDLDGANHIASREATYGVYLTDSMVYKVFGSYETANNEYTETIESDVPVASTVKAFRATLKRDGQPDKAVGVLQTSRITGMFFQMSKNGHEKRLRDAIMQEGDASTALLKRCRSALKAALDARLSDPQGFFDFSAGRPITFIDVHTGAGPNISLQSIYDDIQAKLQEREEI